MIKCQRKNNRPPENFWRDSKNVSHHLLKAAPYRGIHSFRFVAIRSIYIIWIGVQHVLSTVSSCLKSTMFLDCLLSFSRHRWSFEGCFPLQYFLDDASLLVNVLQYSFIWQLLYPTGFRLLPQHLHFYSFQSLVRIWVRSAISLRHILAPYGPLLNKKSM